MRPVTFGAKGQDPAVAACLTEVERASHEGDAGEIFDNYVLSNAPTGDRLLIGSSVQAGSVGNGADTSEDTLFTFSLPALALAVAPNGLTVRAFGTLANNADSKIVRLYFGSQFYSLGSVTTANVGWKIDMTVFKTGANTQTILCQGMIGATPIALTVITGTQTDTSPIVIKVTGQAGTANANDIVGNLLAVAGEIADTNNVLATIINDFQHRGANRTG